MLRRLRPRMPSPAMVVALVALTVAMGGTGYAATKLAKNSVTSQAIKKNAVTSAKIKNGNVKNSDLGANAVAGSKVKNDSLTGADIIEGSLGKVPAAGSADSATKAGSADSATNASHAASADSATTVAGTTRVFKRVTSTATDAVYATARDAATKVPLGSGGTFSVYGKCFKNGTTLNANMYIETSQNGGIVSGYSPTYWYGNLQTNSPEDNRDLIMTSTGNNAASIYDYGDFNAIGADGKVLTADVGVFVKQGTQAGGDGAFGSGDVCIFRYEGRPVATVG